MAHNSVFNNYPLTFYSVLFLQEMQGKGLPNVSEMNGKSQLELLRGISGAFRPGVLTCLMGVSGAGKTTLMDVLSGRKTGQSNTVFQVLPSESLQILAGVPAGSCNYSVSAASLCMLCLVKRNFGLPCIAVQPVSVSAHIMKGIVRLWALC